MSNSEINIKQDGSGNTQNNTFNYNQILQEAKRLGIPLNLPPTNVTFFAGRDADLVEVHQLLEKNQRVAVSAYVKGMGGVGKSELALQYALRHLLTDYRGGICWLQANSDLAIQLRDFVQVQLDRAFPDDLDTMEKLAAYCWRCLTEHLSADPKTKAQPKKMLVILDDVKDYESLKPYLPPLGGDFTVLATTRLELGGAMQQYRLDILELSAAVALLLSFLPMDDPRRTSSEITDLCEWLGRLPLAIELVGRYLALPNQQDTSIADLLKRLQTECMMQLEKLTEEEKKLLPKNLNVVASFNLSWQELSTSAQRLACLLGLFALAPIPWQLAEDAALFSIAAKKNWWQSLGKIFQKKPLEFQLNDLKALRGELLNLHLLQRENQGIYQLHQLLREYFQFQLQQHPEWFSLRQKIVGALLEIAKRIPNSPTIEKISEVTPAIPHLEMMSREMLGDIPNPESSNLGWAFEGIARFYAGQGLYTLAEDLYQRCLISVRKILGEHHPDVANIINNLAVLYEFQGRYEESEPFLKQALSLNQEVFGERHSNVATSLNNLAELYKSQGRYEESEPLLKQALSLRQELFGDRHSDVATSLNNLAELYKSQGRYEESEPLLKQALSLKQELFGDRHPDVATSLSGLAGLYYRQGRYEESEPLLKQALSLR
ncbi:hypothetical protein TUMEXPCC7403_10580 [Tumidithrix helvetica PCC 7403]